MFEPGDSQEAYDMTKAAFEIRGYDTPVLVRATTRSATAKALSRSCAHRVPPKDSPETRKYVMIPGHAGNALPS